MIAVEAAGVSHADVMQRAGQYPPPPGASPILGLEVAGTIARVGERVTQWRAGDRVCALTNGGGYAEYVAVPQGQVLPIPQGWSAIEAATLPENAFTVYDSLVTRARLKRGETVLVAWRHERHRQHGRSCSREPSARAPSRPPAATRSARRA